MDLKFFLQSMFVVFQYEDREISDIIEYQHTDH
jgi:hypothetical protein